VNFNHALFSERLINLKDFSLQPKITIATPLVKIWVCYAISLLRNHVLKSWKPYKNLSSRNCI